MEEKTPVTAGWPCLGLVLNCYFRVFIPFFKNNSDDDVRLISDNDSSSSLCICFLTLQA